MSKLSLHEAHPEIAGEWHPTKNRDILPRDVTRSSGKKVWWRCPKGPDHEWEATVANRTTGRGCPFCAGKKLSVTNSLASRFPELAAEWHPRKNRGLHPNKLVAGSAKKVWWKCPKGPDHEWEAVLSSRTRGGNGCPFCAGQRASVTNSLLALFPDVAAQWHPKKNEALTPDQVVAGSGVKVWWPMSPLSGIRARTAQ